MYMEIVSVLKMKWKVAFERNEEEPGILFLGHVTKLRKFCSLVSSSVQWYVQWLQSVQWVQCLLQKAELDGNE